MTKGYNPFRFGPETGSTGPCPTCGVKPRNGHTLGQLSICDAQKRDERIRLAKQAEATKQREVA